LADIAASEGNPPVATLKEMSVLCQMGTVYGKNVRVGQSTVTVPVECPR